MVSLTAFPFTSELTYDESGWPQLDRAVGSEVLRKVLANYYNNGVFATNWSSCFQVSAPTDGTSTVLVAAGVGLINGATGYKDDVTSLTLPAADASLPRIDTVVLRLNDNTDYRNIYLDIIEGTPASTPAAPDLTQSDSVWELGLANLYRAANSTVITNSNITDTRVDSDRCGYVTAIVELDTSTLMQQLNAYYAEFVDQCEDDYAEYTARCVAIIEDLNTYEGAMETEFSTWFQEMKDQLSEDAAGHLQNEIDDAAELEFNRYYGLVTRTTSFSRNSDGSLASCTATNSDESVTCVTTFNRGTDGSLSSVVNVVTPTAGNYYYTQTATFTRNSDGSLASVAESYTQSLKS